MSKYYIDTSSLVWRYLSGKLTADVNTLIETDTNAVYTNEVTILEWSSALAKSVRRDDIKKNIFKTNEIILFDDIANKRLKIFTDKRIIERARYWIDYIGVANKRALTTMDALHIASAVELASRIKEPIELITSDERLHSIVDGFQVFKPHVTSLYFVQ